MVNTWGIKRDKTTTFAVKGRNGIHYEYIIPLHSYTEDYYKTAIDVRSRKSPTSKWHNGKRPGEYQPIGDKRYFNFYQLKNQQSDYNTDMIEKLCDNLINSVEL